MKLPRDADQENSILAYIFSTLAFKITRVALDLAHIQNWMVMFFSNSLLTKNNLRFHIGYFSSLSSCTAYIPRNMCSELVLKRFCAKTFTWNVKYVKILEVNAIVCSKALEGYAKTTFTWVSNVQSPTYYQISSTQRALINSKGNPNST
jgi:hypothetical protein